MELSRRLPRTAAAIAVLPLLLLLLEAPPGARAAPPATAAPDASNAPPPGDASAATPPLAPQEAEGTDKEAEEEEQAEEEGEEGRALSGGDRVLRALSDRLFDSCVQREALACLGLKAFYATARFADQPEALAQVSAQRARVREATADRVLVGSAAALLSTSLRQARDTLEGDAGNATDDAPAPAAQRDDHAAADGDAEAEGDVGTDRRRAGFLLFSRKMLFPLLIGVVLKLASLIPLVLGKLTLLGTVSLMSSKLSLLILMMMSLRRWLSGGGGGGGGETSGQGHVVSEPPYYPQHHHHQAYAHGYDAHPYETQAHPLAAAPPPEYAHAHAMHAGAVGPGALHGPYRRLYRTYHVVRARQLGGDADWQPRAAARADAAPDAPADAPQTTEGSAEETTTTTSTAEEEAAQLSQALAATEAPPPTTPAAAAAVATTAAPAEQGSALSGFSVAQEDVRSDVRRLDEVEGRLEAH